MDRAPVSGAGNVGSNPAGGTKKYGAYGAAVSKELSWLYAAGRDEEALGST